MLVLTYQPTSCYKLQCENIRAELQELIHM